MPRVIHTVRGSVIEGNDVYLMARVVTADNTVLTTTDTGSTNVTITAFDKSGAGLGRTPDTNVFTLAVADSTVIAALSTDGFWDGLDGTGYNFKYRLLYDTDEDNTGLYMRANHTYLVQCSVVANSSGATFGTIRWAFLLDVLPNDPS